MENNNFDKSKIDQIPQLFESDSLDGEQFALLSDYMDEYDKVLQEYLSTPNPPQELADRLKDLTQPINAMYAQFPVKDENMMLPTAVEYIKSREEVKTLVKKEEDITRKRTPKKGFHSTNRINGFANYVVVLVLTAILGVMLGALLFFLGN